MNGEFSPTPEWKVTFSSGFDLKAQMELRPEGYGTWRRILREDFDAVTRFWSLAKPTIAAVQGRLGQELGGEAAGEADEPWLRAVVQHTYGVPLPQPQRPTPRLRLEPPGLDQRLDAARAAATPKWSR